MLVVDISRSSARALPAQLKKKANEICPYLLLQMMCKLHSFNVKPFLRSLTCI